MISQADYARAFARTRDYIAAGDCYQINLTFPLASRLLSGSPAALRGAFRASGGGLRRLCRSGRGAGDPVALAELFFRLDADGRIEAQPMKGTAAPRPRSRCAMAAGAGGPEKDRAENLMIVDLLRNDIGRISRLGSVRVPELFRRRKLCHRASDDLARSGPAGAACGFRRFAAGAVSCGSITGAPKIRAMQIIREVEPFPRGVYCGSIGWMAPDGAACFSVAIAR